MITALRGSRITGALFPLAGVEGSRTLRHRREREPSSVAAKLDPALGGTPQPGVRIASTDCFSDMSKRLLHENPSNRASGELDFSNHKGSGACK